MAWFDLGRLFKGQSPQERLLRAGIRADIAMAAGRMAGDPRSDPTVREVATQLPDDETALRLMEGRYGKVMGLLVLTDRRVLFFGHEYVGGPLAEVELTSIDRISSGGSVRTGTSVTVTGPDVALTVDRGLALSGEQFAEAVREVRFGSAPVERRDPLEVLAELRVMRDSGRLSEEEFQKQKRRLVDEL
ncbi:SHOCT domain-containing protein [Nakamurella endophytica]|uniref:SHOCT domain-containing protein n=1 Tax=Nakamurella endophytica TaxID=1748367 RepID=A0A917WCJ8_9ACTN|nr:SHOCT domain-containing protein [Nakamurella endophytica]GGL89938.1 hypothetical protein GCM10011594_07000 [Nakamurella endophytica]